MTTIRKRFRRGSAVLDAALVFPVLLSLTFGSIEFGHFFYVKHTLQGAAREGARAAATGTAYSEITDATTRCMGAAGYSNTPTVKYTVDAYVVTGVDASGNPILGTQLTTANFSTTATTGTPILVRVYCTWSTVGIRPMQLLSSSRTVYGMTVMRRET